MRLWFVMAEDSDGESADWFVRAENPRAAYCFWSAEDFVADNRDDDAVVTIIEVPTVAGPPGAVDWPSDVSAGRFDGTVEADFPNT